MKKSQRLPYVNNALAVGITTLIAAVSVFVFHRRDVVSLHDMLVDGAIFGITTMLIDTAIIYPQMKSRYQKGILPAEAPRSVILKRMPRNPALFALLVGLFFAALMPAFNYIFMRFYELDALAFASFLFWRVVYAVPASVYMARLIIFRYVQPGAFAGEVTQHGDAKVSAVLPRISTLKEQYRAALSDFGMNMVLGVILGGARVGMDLGLQADESKWLFIFPAYRSGLPLSSLIYAVIVFFMMAVPVAQNILRLREGGTLPQAEKENRFFSHLPWNPWLFSAVWFVPMLLCTYAFLWGIMTVMRFEVLNFFQYFVLRLILITLLSKGMAALSVIRYIQPI
ncbi:hypothetical protein [Synergistes jonesii]|uniref:hypothetical protein n=1 Tax=Synergistes jonesii TaxID=2754 RepID=UPI00242BBB27|nr:hypothetical protein [Synergistes jonesii]